LIYRILSKKAFNSSPLKFLATIFPDGSTKKEDGIALILYSLAIGASHCFNSET
jgi:hypothetical protein